MRLKYLYTQRLGEWQASTLDHDRSAHRVDGAHLKAQCKKGYLLETFADGTQLRRYKKEGEGTGIIFKVWQAQEVAYRRDLHQEDPLGDANWAGAGNIRSVIDIPFSHGTLAINSAEPNAFNQEDIVTFRRMVAVLSEGFRRMDDLLQLEQRNQELDAHRESLEKQVEERTQSLNRALEGAEQARDSIDAILKSIVDGVIVTDAYSRVLMMNRAAEDLLGVRISELINRQIDYAFDDAELRKRIRELMEDVRSGGGPYNSMEFEWGDRRLQIRPSMVQDRRNQDQGSVLLVHDIAGSGMKENNEAEPFIKQQVKP
jgi:PAS domain S-box-containing protein